MSTPTELPARDFPWDINTGTSAAPSWVHIGGLDTWSHSPTANDADTTVFDDGGRLTHFKASRGDEFTLSGKFQEDPDDGTRDAGQDAVETLDQQVGPDSLKQFRYSTPGGTVKTFDASVSVTHGGGGNDDPAKWEAKVKVSGTITTT